MIPSRVAQRRLLNVVRPTLARSSPTIFTQYRPLTVDSIPESQASSIVAAQRKRRPVSPHLGIYKIQIISVGSILNRATGAVLSGGIYCFGAAYLVSPLFGWHLDVPTMAAAFGSLPVAAKVGIKSLIAWPFAYHSINGIRHLVWDTGAALNNKAVIRTGFTVFGLSAVATVALVAM